jgi:hypothetical protein
MMDEVKTDLSWRQYNGGKRWRTLADGRIEIEGQGTSGTSGMPVTARVFLLEHGGHAHEAARRFAIPVPWIVGMASIEAIRLDDEPKGESWAWSRMADFLALCRVDEGWRRLKALGFDPRGKVNRFRMDPVSLRMEGGYVAPEDTPGRVSAGLMQTLLSTARDMALRYELEPLTLEGERRPVALGDLLCPRLSILYGAAYMRTLMDRDAGLIARLTDNGKAARGCDFALLTGSYNAGSIKPDDPKKGNPFGLLTHGEQRTMRAVNILNDCFKSSARELIEPWALSYPAIPPRT